LIFVNLWLLSFWWGCFVAHGYWTVGISDGSMHIRDEADIEVSFWWDIFRSGDIEWGLSCRSIQHIWIRAPMFLFFGRWLFYPFLLFVAWPASNAGRFDQQSLNDGRPAFAFFAYLNLIGRVVTVRGK